MSDKLTQPRNNHLSFSLELFPPKTDKGVKNLLRQLPLVEDIQPRTVCITSGAGGTGNNRTLSTIRTIQSHTNIPPTAHLTCVANEKKEIQDSLNEYAQEGIYRIVALRGDPNEQDPLPPPTDSYGDAAALVQGIRNRSDGDLFHISVAGYPEVHPKAQSRKSDLLNLKRKVDEGADLILTQFFFEPEIYLQFVEATENLTIDVPIVPGIIVISDFPRISRFAAKCGATIPKWITDRFTNFDADSKDTTSLAKQIAIQQCSKLIENGVRTFHFYTLNQLDLIAGICETLQSEHAPTTEDCTSS